MSTASFARGERFTLDGHEHEIDSRLQDGRIQIRDLATGLITAHVQEALELKYTEGDLRFICPEIVAKAQALDRPIANFTDADWAEAKRRHAYVRGTETVPGTEALLGPAIESVHKELADPLQVPSFSTVLRWRRQYLMGERSIRALLPRRHRSGPHKKQWPERVLDLVHDAIGDVYMHLEQGDITQTHLRARKLVEQENKKHPKGEALEIPSLRLVRRLIKEIPFEKRLKARAGSYAARTALRTVTGEAKYGELAPKAPLDRAEIDHTPLDLFVIDDDTHVLFGRPHLTICVDVFTRCIMGFHVTIEPPNYTSAAQCLRMAMMPKGALLKHYPEVKKPWLAHGIMRELIVDNAFWFHGTSLERAIYTLPTTTSIGFARSKAGEDKGTVEGVLRQVNEGITKGVPGRTFGSIEARGDYAAEKYARVPFKQVISWLYRWINNAYHQKPGRYTQSPAGKWARSIDPSDILIPANPQDFDIIMGTTATRVLGHNGVELEGIFYHADGFRELRRRHGNRISVEIRYNEMDLGEIHVLRPDDKAVITAKARNFDYASGRSLYVHRAVRKRIRERLREDDPREWEETLFELQNEVKELRQQRRPRKLAMSVATATRASRLEEGGVMAPIPRRPPDDIPVAPRLHEQFVSVEPLPAAGIRAAVVGDQSVEYEFHAETNPNWEDGDDRDA